ncbi:hypothetical protein ABC345_21380 [Shouchella sp. 1P09AA]|uniref:hypothetical protein n=1 Tax=unclassified Shouchella TaxID=2893065 RepID=UPI0039A093F6
MRQFKYVMISGIIVCIGFITLDLLFTSDPQIALPRVLGSFITGAVFMLIYYNFVIKKREA